MRMRKKKRTPQRLEALGALTVPEDFTREQDPSELFSDSLPLCLEIGCGKGDFAVGMSLLHPENNFIAMERAQDVIVTAVEKYAVSRSLGEMDTHGGWKAPDGKIYDGVRWNIPDNAKGNVKFMRADASRLEEIFPPEVFYCIYANFSDPWTKSGYANRRLTHPDYLGRYFRLLMPGGYFRFKTDNTELFDFSLESVEASDLKLTFSTRDLHKSERAKDNVMTEFEKKFSNEGIPICALEAQKPE